MLAAARAHLAGAADGAARLSVAASAWKRPCGVPVSWAGSGVGTWRKCEQCDNAQGNTQVFENSGSSYPNGNEWDDWELRCGKCGVFSYVCTFCEG